MPAHTHSRRIEAYFYFNLTPGNMICHLMGEPQEEKTGMAGQRTGYYVAGMVYSCSCRNKQLYVYLGMAGENLDYGDMDKISYTEMK